MSDKAKSKADKPADTKSITDVIAACRAKWSWFVVSFVVVFGLSILNYLCTEPVYEQTAAILVKENSSPGSLMGLLGDFGSLSMTSDVNNELEAIKSPALVQKVVANLDLNTGYYRVGMFRDHTLYGDQVPFLVSFPDAKDDQYIELESTLDPEGELIIKKITVKVRRHKDKYKEDIKCDIAACDTVVTPAGKIFIAPNPAYNPATLEEKYRGRTLKYKVTWRSVSSAARKFETELDASIPNKKAAAIEIVCQDNSKTRANAIIDELIKVYNQAWMEDENRINQATLEFIDQRLAVVQDELNSVDSDITDYKSKNKLPDLQVSVMTDISRLNEVDRRLLETQSQLTMAKNIDEYINNPDNANKLLPNVAITGMADQMLDATISEYNKLMMERNRLATTTSLNNPLVIDYDSRLKNMRNTISQSVRNQEAALQTAVNDMKADRNLTSNRIANSPTQANDLISIERQQKVKEALYLFLLEKREENEITQTFVPYNIRVLTPPMGTGEPISPNFVRLMLLAFVFAIVIPVGIIYLKLYFDDTVKQRNQIDDVLKAPFLGTIPLDGNQGGRIGRLFSRKKIADATSEIVVKSGNGNPINEAFRSIRSNINLMNARLGAADEKGVVMMITSAIPSSGKTFVAMNIAAAMALKKKRVVVVDFDLRKGTLSKSFHAHGPGLSSYLTGTADIDKIVVKNIDGNEYLNLIPSGPLPPNPAELLDTPETEGFINELRKRFDVVLLDCPPTEPVTDSQIITKYVDRTIYVIRYGLLHTGFLGVLQSYYEDKRYTNMAIIFNAVEGQAAGTSGYGYGYGYGYSTKD